MKLGLAITTNTGWGHWWFQVRLANENIVIIAVTTESETVLHKAHLHERWTAKYTRDVVSKTFTSKWHFRDHSWYIIDSLKAKYEKRNIPLQPIYTWVALLTVQNLRAEKEYVIRILFWFMKYKGVWTNRRKQVEELFAAVTSEYMF